MATTPTFKDRAGPPGFISLPLLRNKVCAARGDFAT
jgi:hypothetical protein